MLGRKLTRLEFEKILDSSKSRIENPDLVGNYGLHYCAQSTSYSDKKAEKTLEAVRKLSENWPYQPNLGAY